MKGGFVAVAAFLLLCVVFVSSTAPTLPNAFGLWGHQTQVKIGSTTRTATPTGSAAFSFGSPITLQYGSAAIQAEQGALRGSVLTLTYTPSQATAESDKTVTVSLEETSLYVESVKVVGSGITNIQIDTDRKGFNYKWVAPSTNTVVKVEIRQAGVGFVGRRWDISQTRWNTLTTPKKTVGVVKYDNPTRAYNDNEAIWFQIPSATPVWVKAVFNDRTITLQAYDSAKTNTIALPATQAFEFTITPRAAADDHVLDFAGFISQSGKATADIVDGRTLHIVLTGAGTGVTNQGQTIVYFGSNGLARVKYTMNNIKLFTPTNVQINPTGNPSLTAINYPGYQQLVTVVVTFPANLGGNTHTVYCIITQDEKRPNISLIADDGSFPALASGYYVTADIDFDTTPELNPIPDFFYIQGASDYVQVLDAKNSDHTMKIKVYSDGGALNFQFAQGLVGHAYKFKDIAFRGTSQTPVPTTMLGSKLYFGQSTSYKFGTNTNLKITVSDTNQLKFDVSNMPNGAHISATLVPADDTARGFSKVQNQGGSAVTSEWYTRNELRVRIYRDGQLNVALDPFLFIGPQYSFCDYQIEGVLDTFSAAKYGANNQGFLGGGCDTTVFGDGNSAVVLSTSGALYGQNNVINGITTYGKRIVIDGAATFKHIPANTKWFTFNIYASLNNFGNVRVLKNLTATPAGSARLVEGGKIWVNVTVGAKVQIDVNFWDCDPKKSGENCDINNDPSKVSANTGTTYKIDGTNGNTVKVTAAAGNVGNVQNYARFVFDPNPTVPTPADGVPLPTDFSTTGFSFELFATDVNGARITTNFAAPITLDFKGPEVDSNTQIFILIDNVWTNLATTCTTAALAGAAVRTWTAATSILTYKVCHFTTFASFQLTPIVNETYAASTDPDALITILGQGFGTDDTLVEVNLATDLATPVPCAVQPPIQEDMVICKSAGHAGANIAATIKVSQNTATFKYTSLAPVINTVAGPTIGAAKGDTITIKGANLGNQATDVKKITVAGLPCTNIVWAALGELHCDAPYGIGINNDVYVYIANTGADAQNNTATKQVTYKTPTIIKCNANYPIVVTAASTYGGLTDNITLCGTNLGDDNLAVAAYTGVRNVHVGQQIATYHTANFVSHLSSLPEGAGLNNAVYIDVNGVKLAVPFVVNYPAPTSTGVTPSVVSSHARATGTRITVFGTNFGPNIPSLYHGRHITVGGAACTDVQYISHIALSCVAPAGTGANLPVVVTIAGQTSELLHSTVLDYSVSAVQGLACSLPNGAQDPTDPEICNCFSGFAPANNLLNTECSVAATCPGYTIQNNMVGGHAPHAPKSTFSGDHLTLVQKMAIVHGRRDVHISFVNGNNTSIETCNYPSAPIWSKTVDSLDCLDVFSVVIPWTQHASCAFVEAAAHPINYRVYTATMLTTFRELLPATTAGSTVVTRTSTTAFEIVVKFQRTLTAVTKASSVAVTEDLNIGVVVVDDIVYDPETLQTFVVVDTTAKYPFMLTALTGNWTPAAGNVLPSINDVNVVVTLQSPQPGNAVCDIAGDCTQRWTVSIKNAGPTSDVCNLRGIINLAPTVQCSNSVEYGACTGVYNIPHNVTLIFGDDTDLCETSSEDVDASKGTALAIRTYEDSALGFAQSTFGPGDIVYVALQLTDPISTIDEATINRITLTGTSGPQVLYGVSTPGGVATTNVPKAEINVTSELKENVNDPLSPGSEFVLAFSFRASREVASLSALSASATPVATLTIEVVIDLSFHGNYKKRSVVAMNTDGSVQKLVTAGIQLINEEAEEDNIVVDELQTTNEDLVFDLFASSASSTVVSVFAAIFAVAVLLF